MFTTLFISFVFVFVLQMLFFQFAAGQKTDKLTDFAYGITFVLLGFYFYFLNAKFYPIQTIVFLLVTIWGLRLTTYLFIRILKMGRDRRFDGIREDFIKFFKFWVLQAFAIWLIMSPAVLVLDSRINIYPSATTLIGVIIWGIGFWFETVADWQKFKFKSKKANKDNFIDTGLWGISRHPNYFGEILVWWGIFVISIPYLIQDQLALLTIIGPIFIIYLLVFVTGIPTIEKKYNKKYKNDKKYQKYKANTAILVPFIKL